MHHIYHTHGFVLGSHNKGEANKMLTVYTREMGLVRAMVQGVRLHKSKLRFSLQDFSYARIDFVRGKEIWRITSASNISSFPFARSSKSSLLIIARISKLLERLCDGEESNEKIFDDFIQAIVLLDDIEVSSESREALELHLVLRILNTLGYIGDSLMLMDYLGGNIDLSQTETLLREKRSIISHINKALNESQL
ncbi:TPA: DNA repair protein RecO [Candidatus Nomurabacteria bacterium]|uniref:Repair protein RecO protein n=1 Tax=Candidatus Nomurabacteria bacterium GW2011_GWE1_35_16 TaxID=1618761 RepID=A0A0G0EHV5_9BACT|nr:MAG: repair protein RecO protein [Candidatus Nomurabacteria bacterium GW2011_GWF1_34_20]KKP63690.1 MAG: repair protein RecO protein [Candidatus Nomurabacteria bacterium GW2011_GWE2_34_25]KKP66892.1 MAG: repair protein RecO protein [Candidatus Nomurabacteria bacterium GW2011_GWE1_35_16]KKP83518.1 MAG: repair protein RecO protein [Candidatus Nomurabacteria bacterium GW2011_GWF2_35_66]HAE36550.1 DNA repair protein RecO [Candidatus Nomurabacteria bacterium]